MKSHFWSLPIQRKCCWSKHLLVTFLSLVALEIGRKKSTEKLPLSTKIHASSVLFKYRKAIKIAANTSNYFSPWHFGAFVFVMCFLLFWVAFVFLKHVSTLLRILDKQTSGFSREKKTELQNTYSFCPDWSSLCQLFSPFLFQSCSLGWSQLGFISSH